MYSRQCTVSNDQQAIYSRQCTSGNVLQAMHIRQRTAGNVQQVMKNRGWSTGNVGHGMQDKKCRLGNVELAIQLRYMYQNYFLRGILRFYNHAEAAVYLKTQINYTASASEPRCLMQNKSREGQRVVIQFPRQWENGTLGSKKTVQSTRGRCPGVRFNLVYTRATAKTSSSSAICRSYREFIETTYLKVPSRPHDTYLSTCEQYISRSTWSRCTWLWSVRSRDSHGKKRHSSAISSPVASARYKNM